MGNGSDHWYGMKTVYDCWQCNNGVCKINTSCCKIFAWHLPSILSLVNHGDYIKAVLDRNLAENITRVLYPNDNVSCRHALPYSLACSATAHGDMILPCYQSLMMLMCNSPGRNWVLSITRFDPIQVFYWPISNKGWGSYLPLAAASLLTLDLWPLTLTRKWKARSCVWSRSTSSAPPLFRTLFGGSRHTAHAWVVVKEKALFSFQKRYLNHPWQCWLT